MAFSKEKAHERAERYAAKGQHDKAAREYQTIVENDPKDVRAWLMLADCLVRCNDKPGAVERYIRVAQYYVDAKEHNKALAVYRQVVNLDPQRLDIQAKMAQLNLQVGHTQDGIALYERVAHAQLQAGRIADALATYKLVADADPSAVPRRLRLAELYSREKRTKEAVEAFRAAGEQLRLLGRPADYVRVAERLLYHDEADHPTVRELARVYLQLGDPRRALVKLNGLLRSNAKDAEGIELLAETFMALEKPDKALSALEELIRCLRAKGPEAEKDMIRILRRGLEWRPGHAGFREALIELEGRQRKATPPPTPAPEPESEPESIDDVAVEEVDDDDLLELDDDDLVVEDADDEPEPEPRAVDLPGAASSAPGARRTMEVEALPSTEPSLTQSVLSEVEADVAMPDTEGMTDFDKILFEAKVYIKYRLFEHALDHVRTALQQQPDHVGAMTIEAKALTELGRAGEAAQVHLTVAEQVTANEPKLAREHLERARTLFPDDPRVEALERTLAASAPQPASTLRPATPGRLGPPEEDGDSGAFDLVAGFEDEGSPPGVALDLEGEPKANLVAAHDHEVVDPMTQPFTPIDLDADEAVPVSTQSSAAIEVPMEDEVTPIPPSSGPAEEPAPEPALEAGEPEPELDEGFDGDLELDLEPAPRPGEGVPTQAISLDPDLTDAVQIGAPTPEPEPEPDELDLLPDIEPEPEPDELDLLPDIEPEPEPVAAEEAEPDGDWPDLADELDEIRFYVEQGLDDDAEAALDDLEEQYPGHPQIAKFRGKSAPAPAKPTPKPAAKPTPQPAAKLTPKPAAKPTPKPAAKTLPKLGATPLPKLGATPLPKLGATSIPKPTPIPKPEPEPEPDELDLMPDIEAEPDELDLMPDIEAEPEPGLPEAFNDDDLVALDEQDDAAAAPLVSFDDDDDDDDYLSAIFADPVKPKAKPKTNESSAGANLAEGQSVDAATAFDLGVAYREMGLVDQAISQFEGAAHDPQWRARALTLIGALRLHRGETDQAVTDLQEAVKLASTPSEISEAAYELGVLYEVIGDTEAAIQQLLTVAPGYRDRDERLAALGF